MNIPLLGSSSRYSEGCPLPNSHPGPRYALRETRFYHIDGEAVACDDNGVTSFNRVRYRRHDESIFLYAFDLIELNGVVREGRG
jgi:hypothetical protein